MNMENLFDTKNREDIVSRLSKVNHQLKPKWGVMSAHQMIVHMSDPFRVALKERIVPYVPSEYGEPPFNIQVSQTLPWPKNSNSIPEFTQGDKGTELTDFDSDMNTLLDLINRFGELADGDPVPMHPVFGYLTNEEWARVMWRHLDHHLNQFGL